MSLNSLISLPSSYHAIVFHAPNPTNRIACGLILPSHGEAMLHLGFNYSKQDPDAGELSKGVHWLHEASNYWRPACANQAREMLDSLLRTNPIAAKMAPLLGPVEVHGLANAKQYNGTKGKQ